jgi:hypothetical protein
MASERNACHVIWKENEVVAQWLHSGCTVVAQWLHSGRGVDSSRYAFLSYRCIDFDMFQEFTKP